MQLGEKMREFALYLCLVNLLRKGRQKKRNYLLLLLKILINVQEQLRCQRTHGLLDNSLQATITPQSISPVPSLSPSLSVSLPVWLPLKHPSIHHIQRVLLRASRAESCLMRFLLINCLFSSVRLVFSLGTFLKLLNWREKQNRLISEPFVP